MKTQHKDARRFFFDGLTSSHLSEKLFDPIKTLFLFIAGLALFVFVALAILRGLDDMICPPHPRRTHLWGR